MENIITREEREAIYDDMTNLLDKYGYNWTADAIYEIIDTWAEQKADLIRLFKKHPNYVEGKFLIAFNQDWNREINTEGAWRFARWIDMNLPVIYENLPCRLKQKVDDWQCTHYYYTRIYIPRETNFLYSSTEVYARQLMDEDSIEWFNDIDPELHFTVGMKMSRAINKLCTYLGINKLPDYNKEFAKYADSVNPLKIVRHTILSINPLDYLTMSFGNSWASCHTIDKENVRCMPNSYHGQYSSGTISYMLDKVSMVFYTVDAEYDGNEYYFEDKINRCMFHYGKDKLIQGRVYPQDNDNNGGGIYKDIREIVQRVLTTCLEIPNYWNTKRGIEYIGDYVETRGTHYPDYRNFNNCCISFPKDMEINECQIVIGHKPICVNCGYEHSDSENIDHCAGSRVTCENCGCTLDEDDAYIIGGEYYCSDCCYQCEHCDEYHTRDDVNWVEETDGWVCDCCLEYHYTRCEVCDDFHRDYNTTYLDNYCINVCDDCRDEHYTECDECGCYIRNRDINSDTEGHNYCDDCWESICEENENEEEAM